MKTNFAFFILFITSISLYSQDIIFPEWGKFSEYEKSLKTYTKDSTAHAVVLSEVGNAYVKYGGNFNIVKEHYVRIKILRKDGYKYATVEIPYYKDEHVFDVKGSTTNILDETVTALNKSKIYKTKVTEKWHQTSFTLPNIKVGSIIEYSYKTSTPYHQTFADGWVFQGDIPKIKSTFYAKIPGFWQYHITSRGIYNPRFTNNKIIDDCLTVFGGEAQCLFLELELKDIPAFIEEDFFTSKKNYLKQLNFELKTFTNSNLDVTQYTKTWKDTDKMIFKDYQIGYDYDNTRFIRKHIPEEILNEPDKLEKVKRVFSFVQQHFNNNDKAGSFYKYNSKKAFEEKVGNLFEINASLINALNAAQIKTEFALLSTRKNGFPNRTHPVITDFNYMLAYVNIEGKDYFLDASVKDLPFGMLPFHCLNGKIRVFNEKKGSYWYDYFPKEENETVVYSIANITDDSNIEMQTRVVYKGYKAYDKREKIRELTVPKYKDEIDELNEELNITKHEIKNLNDTDELLTETYEFIFETDLVSDDLLYFKPFVIKDFKTNPFTLEERRYPVDLGYKRKFRCNLIFNLPENFTVKNIPKNRNIVLPNKGGTLAYLSNISGNKITINFAFSLDKIVYTTGEYNSLKEFMSQLIIAQNEMIILTKK